MSQAGARAATRNREPAGVPAPGCRPHDRTFCGANPRPGRWPCQGASPRQGPAAERAFSSPAIVPARTGAPAHGVTRPPPAPGPSPPSAEATARRPPTAEPSPLSARPPPRPCARSAPGGLPPTPPRRATPRGSNPAGPGRPRPTATTPCSPPPAATIGRLAPRRSRTAACTNGLSFSPDRRPIRQTGPPPPPPPDRPASASIDTAKASPGAPRPSTPSRTTPIATRSCRRNVQLHECPAGRADESNTSGRNARSSLDDTRRPAKRSCALCSASQGTPIAESPRR